MPSTFCRRALWVAGIRLSVVASAVVIGGRATAGFGRVKAGPGRRPLRPAPLGSRSAARAVRYDGQVFADDQGRYRIERRLAVGGMGEVFLAQLHTQGLSRPVALKVVRPELVQDARFASLFVEEARVAMRLCHANLVQAFDVGQLDDRWFIAMEYVDGLSLAELLRKLGRPMQLPHAILVAVEVLKGLDYAHRRKSPDTLEPGIVHLDVSPSNVLLSREGEVKVADFGIARAGAGQRAQRVAGKLPYMAPEQVRGGPVDARTDLYAVGALLYEMLVLAPPVAPQPDRERMMEAIVAGRITTPRDRGAQPIPEPLCAILMRALRTEPTDRFPTGAAMRQALEGWALDAGLLLSTSDLGDVVRAAGSAPEERASTTPARSTPPADNPPARGAGPLVDPFDAMLGQELRLVDTGAAYSVWRTEAAPTATPLAEAGSATAPIAPSEARAVDRAATRRRAGLVGVAAAVGLLAFALFARPFFAEDSAVAADASASVATKPAPQPYAAARSQAAGPRRSLASAVVSGENAVEDAPRAALADTPPRLAPASAPLPAPPSAPSSALPSAPPSERAAPSAVSAPPRSAPRPPAHPARTPRPSPPTRRASRPAPETLATGWLSANTRPWSFVELDGQRLRATPVVRAVVAAGAHRLRFVRPDGRAETRRVHIAPGEHERVSFDLRP